MCGISGILSVGQTEENSRRICEEMSYLLRHRGPDDSGVWTDARGVGLGHARLSIVDLSNAGKQPMSSNSGRYVVCYNGEIYNFRELQVQLSAAGVELSGHSDTETLVECIEEFGLDWTIKRSHGMFAFALWDRDERQLTLVRDRFGEKPLYYGLIGQDLVFVSELKAVRAHSGFSSDIDKQALSGFMKYGYVAGADCIYSGFKKLPAASIVLGADARELFDCRPRVYWNAEITATGEPKSVADLEGILTDVVGKQMLADVPIGSFLSGGVDSSLVTALMQKQSARAVDTFTIGFKDPAYDESVYAKDVSRHLGTRHTEWIIDEQDIQNLIPDIAGIYDEPFADSSLLPTTLLSRLTRQSVTVCLSGDGGDELFYGYPRYAWMEKINRRLCGLPRPVRKSAISLIGLCSPETWQRAYEKVSRFSPVKVTDLDQKVQWVSDFLGDNGAERAYDQVMSHWQNPASLVLGGVDVDRMRGTFSSRRSLAENLMMHDARNYLIDDLMVKVDRAAMSCSLESRAPLLDHSVFECAMSMPVSEKIKNGQTKAPLREILYKHVPSNLIERPKKGFSVPLESWMRNELRDWVNDTLDSDKIKSQGILNHELIEKYRVEHMKGVANWQYLLWDVLVFQEWYECWNK
ncbi:MAG: asparagine synthase (glutamine-hydrolyzing) [Granulosicoccus sp.]